MGGGRSGGRRRGCRHGVRSGRVGAGIVGDQLIVRSTTQRSRPSPRGRAVVFGRGIVALIPRARRLFAVTAGVVGAIAEQPFRPPTGPATFAAHRRDRIDERQQLEDVVAGAGREREREQSATSAGERMVLGAASGAVYRAWTGLLAPPTARTCELSITARDQSIRSASCSLASSTSCSRCRDTGLLPLLQPSPAGHARARNPSPAADTPTGVPSSTRTGSP